MNNNHHGFLHFDFVLKDCDSKTSDLFIDSDFSDDLLCFHLKHHVAILQQYVLCHGDTHHFI